MAMDAPQHEAMLSVEELAIDVDHRRLLDGVGFALSTGEMIGLSGPSGCGKTTLLRAIAGLIDPAGGRVTLDGRSPEQIGWPRFRRQVVLVHQRPVVHDGTVSEVLRRPFRYRTSAGPFDPAGAGELFDALRLGGLDMQQRARTLSVGQQQRLCLARALLVDPRVLLLDEPTSALDGPAVDLVEGLLRRRCDRGGLACAVVTHDRQQIARWCDREVDLAGHLAKGQEAAS